MKILLTIDNKAQQQTEYGEIPVHLSNLESIQQCSCISIDSSICIDYVNYEMRPTLIKILKNKMRVGCILTVSGTDIYSMLRMFKKDIVDISEFNNHILNGRVSIGSIQEIKELLVSEGLSIVEMMMVNGFYTIKARRDK